MEKVGIPDKCFGGAWGESVEGDVGKHVEYVLVFPGTTALGSALNFFWEDKVYVHGHKQRGRGRGRKGR